MDVLKGATDQTIFMELVDSTTGLPKTGIVYTDVTGSYARTRGARVAITMATLANASAAHSDGGFILVDDTNQPGVYRIDVPDAAFATGAREVVITLKATGCRTVSRSIDLVNIDNQTAPNNLSTTDVNGVLEAYRTNGVASDNDAQVIIGGNTQINGVVDSIYLDTVNIGTAGIGLNNIPWNAAWDAQVESEVTDALNAYDPPTRAELTTDTNSVLTAVGDVPTNSELTTALSSIATAANQTKTLDRLGYLMAQEIGACANAGTSAETYTITIDATTYTIDHTGLTDVGVRGIAVLTKT